MGNLYDVVENEGFGVIESPIVEKDRKTFHSIKEAIIYLDSNRKDKNLSWSNWETPYTYHIDVHYDGKLLRRLNKTEIEDITKDIFD